jgi:hypothetical protein
MQIDNVIGKGQLVALPFVQINCAASQSDVALTVAEVSDGYVMPSPGEVVGVTVRSNAARTGGTLTADALIRGTAAGLTAVLNATTTNNKVSKQPRGKDEFSAGAYIGAKVTTDASWTPVTADIVVTVWVLLYLDGV